MSDSKKPDRLAYSVTEAAQVLGLGKTTLYCLMNSRKLPYCRIGTLRRIRAADLEAFIATRADMAA